MPNKKLGIEHNNIFNQGWFENQTDLFTWIWNNRPHVSEVSGLPIDEMSAWCFAHVLPKGAYKAMKLYHKNIILVLPSEHVFYDQSGKASDDPLWSWVFVLKEQLKRDYYLRSKNNFLY